MKKTGAGEGLSLAVTPKQGHKNVWPWLLGTIACSEDPQSNFSCSFFNGPSVAKVVTGWHSAFELYIDERQKYLCFYSPGFTVCHHTYVHSLTTMQTPKWRGPPTRPSSIPCISVWCCHLRLAHPTTAQCHRSLRWVQRSAARWIGYLHTSIHYTKQLSFLFLRNDRNFYCSLGFAKTESGICFYWKHFRFFRDEVRFFAP